MNADFPPVAQLLPHAGRAVLIDTLLENSRDAVRAVARITSAHPFFVPGKGVPAWVGVEMMAQTIAAHAGLEGRAEGRSPRAGLLLGTRRYRMYAPFFAQGANLVVEADRAGGGPGGVAACECRILDGETRLVEAAITIIEINTGSGQ
jgi:predicted hotdog family 3-hydroxylacyl-ACP dehydratase